MSTNITSTKNIYKENIMKYSFRSDVSTCSSNRGSNRSNQENQRQQKMINKVIFCKNISEENNYPKSNKNINKNYNEVTFFAGGIVSDLCQSQVNFDFAKKYQLGTIEANNTGVNVNKIKGNKKGCLKKKLDHSHSIVYYKINSVSTKNQLKHEMILNPSLTLTRNTNQNIHYYYNYNTNNELYNQKDLGYLTINNENPNLRFPFSCKINNVFNNINQDKKEKNNQMKSAKSVFCKSQDYTGQIGYKVVPVIRKIKIERTNPENISFINNELIDSSVNRAYKITKPNKPLVSQFQIHQNFNCSKRVKKSSHVLNKTLDEKDLIKEEEKINKAFKTTRNSLTDIKKRGNQASIGSKNKKFISKLTKENITEHLMKLHPDYEYLDEIYQNLLQEESDLFIKIRSDYFIFQKEINYYMRYKVFNWIAEINDNFGFMDKTVLLTFYLIDAYLSINVIKPKDFCLVALASLLISSKHCEMKIRTLSDYCYICNNLFTEIEIKQMEKRIAKVFDFNFNAPTVLSFYEILASFFWFRENENMFKFGLLLIELFLIDGMAVNYSYSAIACAGTYATIKYYGNSDYNYSCLFEKDLFNDFSTNKSLLKPSTITEISQLMTENYQKKKKENNCYLIKKYDFKDNRHMNKTIVKS